MNKLLRTVDLWTHNLEKKIWGLLILGLGPLLLVAVIPGISLASVYPLWLALIGCLVTALQAFKGVRPELETWLDVQSGVFLICLGWLLREQPYWGLILGVLGAFGILTAGPIAEEPSPEAC